MRFRGLLALLVVMLLASAAYAQEQTGSIVGVVKDAQGGVLPGVTVEARSPSVVGVSTAITDERGNFRFPALPPGTFEVSASLQGFNTAKSQASLALGQTLNLTLTLTVGGVTETVQVTGESPLIDVKQAAKFTTVNQEVIERIPKGRDFASVVSTAAGAQQEARQGGIRWTARPAPRTGSSSTAWTRPTCRRACRARRCCSTSSRKCR